MNDANQPIGIFDSGVGGISVASQMRTLLPGEDMVYYGDTAYAPYGTRSAEEVLTRSRIIAHYFMDVGAKALVIACNTATSVAAATLRAELSIPVIGMEPALKPASEKRHGGSVLVMATPMTLMLPKFQALMERYGEGAVPLPCPGLMEFAERGEFDGDALHAHLVRLLDPWWNRPVDAVVLGCTHYIYLRAAIARCFPPETMLVDGNLGTARQVRRVLQEHNMLYSGDRKGGIELVTSGDSPHVLPLMRQLWEAGFSGKEASI